MSSNLRETWSRMTEEQRAQLICYLIGTAFMAIGIVAQWGVNGAYFCLGFALWKISRL